LVGLLNVDSEDETAGDDTAEDDTAEDEMAGGDTAGDETAQAHTAADETTGDNTNDDKTTQASPAESEITTPNPNILEVSTPILSSQQPKIPHRSPLNNPILHPLNPLLPSITNALTIGTINQSGYDQEYGLKHRSQLEIPRSWREGGRLDDRLYSDVLGCGWYSQDVALMRFMIWVASGLMVQTGLVD
jgi:hypothetical protein